MGRTRNAPPVERRFDYVEGSEIEHDHFFYKVEIIIQLELAHCCGAGADAFYSYFRY